MYECISKVIERTPVIVAFVERVYFKSVRVAALEFVKDCLDGDDVLMIRGWRFARRSLP